MTQFTDEELAIEGDSYGMKERERLAPKKRGRPKKDVNDRDMGKLLTASQSNSVTAHGINNNSGTKPTLMHYSRQFPLQKYRMEIKSP